MKRSRRVFLMMMGATAATVALPAAAVLAAPCPPDPRLLNNANPDRPRNDCAPSRGLPGNRFGHRLRAGG